MSEQRCECSHVFSIHRLNRQIGDRNECWALGHDDQSVARWCQCRQFRAARPATDAVAEGE